ncbi:hypothetical protein BcepF1.105 [Burkholderia phage BcepF1]|uniref:Uncharacterized protein n=1 Tax=Burkholderia phage BcepF1 TaxID=2886897 RepID=A1Z009_9CAUD|nr:tail fiber protein [Burkholderia phage BcepF1]ABL96836.1 hypothetical protein BcepF1.105 [Burkholderia phage BcepF1]
MASSILSSLFSQASFRITDETTTFSRDVAKGLKIRRVTIRYVSTTHEHRREDGSTIVDARTIQPTLLTVEAIAPDLDTLSQITNVAADRNGVYRVTTKGVILPTMRIESQSIRQSSDMLSASPVQLQFKQMLVQGRQPIVFAQGADSSLIDRGMAILTSAKETISDIAGRIQGAF